MIKINDYPIDLAVTEQHRLESEITDDPVETGSDTSDNIHNRPREIELEGWVSDTPIGEVALDQTRVATQGVVPHSRTAYLRLLDIRAAREPVTIETDLEKLESMGLLSLSIPIDSKTGKGLHFTVTFKQVNISTNNRTTTRTAVPNCRGKVNGGNRQPLKGVNGKPVPGAFESVPRYVNSYATASRRSLVPSRGEPIFTSSHAQRLATGSKVEPFPGVDLMDHYDIGTGTVSDGFIQRGADHKDAFYSMTVAVDKFGRRSGVGSSTTNIATRIGDENVHYDYADQSWKSDSDNHVVKKVPAGKDRWDGVKWGKAPQ